MRRVLVRRMCPSVVVSRTLYLNLLLERYAISQFVDAEGIAIFQHSLRNGAMSWRGDDNFANWRVRTSGNPPERDHPIRPEGAFGLDGCPFRIGDRFRLFLNRAGEPWPGCLDYEFDVTAAQCRNTANHRRLRGIDPLLRRSGHEGEIRVAIDGGHLELANCRTPAHFDRSGCADDCARVVVRAPERPNDLVLCDRAGSGKGNCSNRDRRSQKKRMKFSVKDRHEISSCGCWRSRCLTLKQVSMCPVAPCRDA